MESLMHHDNLSFNPSGMDGEHNITSFPIFANVIRKKITVPPSKNLVPDEEVGAIRPW